MRTNTLPNSWEPGRQTIESIDLSPRVTDIILDARLDALEKQTSKVLILDWVMLLVIIAAWIWVVWKIDAAPEVKKEKYHNPISAHGHRDDDDQH